MAIRGVAGIAFFGAALVITLPILLYTGRASMMTFIGDFGMSMFGHGGGESGETLPLNPASRPG